VARPDGIIFNAYNRTPGRGGLGRVLAQLFLVKSEQFRQGDDGQFWINFVDLADFFLEAAVRECAVRGVEAAVNQLR